MTQNSKNAQGNPQAVAPCSDMKVNLINAGKFIEIEDAVESLQAYFDIPGTPAPDDPTHVYGHTFGLNKFRALLTNMDHFNENLEPGQPPIDGIRIYYGNDKRDDPDFRMNPPDGLFRDLIFIPVLEDGTDLFPIDQLTNPELILSSGRPCPNQCGLTFRELL